MDNGTITAAFILQSSCQTNSLFDDRGKTVSTYIYINCSTMDS